MACGEAIQSTTFFYTAQENYKNEYITIYSIAFTQRA